MKRLHLLPLLGASLMLASIVANAQSSDGGTGGQPAVAMQMKMERSEFLQTHMWDASSDVWVLRAGVEPPAGIKSRASVKAERDMFLSNNRWDDPTSKWVPLGTTPRRMSSMSSEQMRGEVTHFHRTHAWNETTGAWIPKTVGASQ